MPMLDRLADHLTHNPARLALISFASLIVVGTLLLALPWSSSEEPINLLAALFTATSSVCVTGLAVLDTGRDFSRFGQVVLLGLIQLGGLGMMVWSGGALLLLGRKLGLAQRAVLEQTVPGLSLSGAGSLVRNTVLFTLGCEAIGALLLWLAWGPRWGWLEGGFHAVFHSVSAFCNAGFALYSDSLTSDVSHPLVNVVIMALIVIGGLGYLLLLDLWNSRRLRRRPLLQTRIALLVTAVLIVVPAGLFFLMERSNPATLGALSWDGQLWASLFQSVTCRTAGYNTVPIGSCREETLLMMVGLMVIGGSPGSTAGGIKTTTLAVLLVAVLAYLRGRRDIVIWERKIPQQRLAQSLATTGVFVALIWLGTTVLCALNPAQMMVNLFEVASAVATVGLSAGTTAAYSPASKLALCFLMFVGRVGPLVMAVSLAGRPEEPLRYVKEDVNVG